jgi:hypothetical protein
MAEEAEVDLEGQNSDWNLRDIGRETIMTIARRRKTFSK